MGAECVRGGLGVEGENELVLFVFYLVFLVEKVALLRLAVSIGVLLVEQQRLNIEGRDARCGLGVEDLG
jgi:hypothetical protein